MGRHRDINPPKNKFVELARRNQWEEFDLTQQEVFAVDSGKREPWTVKDRAYSLLAAGNYPRAIANCLGLKWPELVALMGTEFCESEPGRKIGEATIGVGE